FIDRLPAGDRRTVEHQALCKGIVVDHADVKSHVLPLAARIGETQVDVFDVVVLDRLQDVFGGLHEYPFWLLVEVIWPPAATVGDAIQSREAQHNIGESAGPSDGVQSGFAGSDANGLLDVGHENLAVADPPGLRRAPDRVDRLLDQIVRNHD